MSVGEAERECQTPAWLWGIPVVSGGDLDLDYVARRELVGGTVGILTRFLGVEGTVGFIASEVEVKVRVEGFNGCYLQVPVPFDSREGVGGNFDQLREGDELLILAELDLRPTGGRGKMIIYEPFGVLRVADQSKVWGSGELDFVKAVVDCRE